MRAHALALCCGLALAAGALADPAEARRKLDEARPFFNEYCQSDGFDAGQCDRAIALLREAAAADPDLVEAQVELGKALWNRGFAFPKEDRRRDDLKNEARTVLQRLVDKNVRDARPYYELSVRTADAPQRQKLLERTVQMEPRHPEAHKDLAEILLSAGRRDDAMREYRIHMEVSPRKELQDTFDHLRFARQLSALGAQKEAGEIYGKVAELTKEEPRSRRCMLFRKVPAQAFPSAPWAQDAAKLQPFCADEESVKSAAKLEHQGDSKAAAQTLETRLKANPANDELALPLRRLYRSQGKGAQAAQVTQGLFQQERDPAERCRIFRALPADAKAELDAPAREALERDCPPRSE